MDRIRLPEGIALSLPVGWQDQLPPEIPATDIARMQLVLKLAEWNVRSASGGPFAAAVFERGSGDLVSIGLNCVLSQQCSLAHAEAMAISLAQHRIGTHDLSSTDSKVFDLYTSGQPCVQCYGIFWWSGITRLVIGARAADIEELTEFQEGPLPPDWQQQLESRSPLPSVTIVRDMCREESRAVLSAYSAAGGHNYSPGPGAVMDGGGAR